MELSKKTILLFLVLLILIFIYDTVLFHILWPPLKNIVDKINFAYSRIYIFRFVSLTAIILGVLTLKFLIKQKTKFYLLAASVYIAIDALWLQMMMKGQMTPNDIIASLLPYVIELILAITGIIIIGRVSNMKNIDKAVKKSSE